MLAAAAVLGAFVLLCIACSIPSITHRLNPPKGNRMTATEGPLPQHELDQVLAALKDDGIGRPHVIGTLAMLDTLLDELPVPPPGTEAYALVRLVDVRAGIQAHKDRFVQVLNALGADA